MAETEDICQWPELSNEEDCFGSNVGSSVDSSLCISEQDNLSYANVASVVDFDREDSDVNFCFDSDEGSVVELEWNTWCKSPSYVLTILATNIQVILTFKQNSEHVCLF